MKAILAFIFIAAVAFNVIGNSKENTPEALEQRNNTRIEKLCRVNTRYCV